MQIRPLGNRTVEFPDRRRQLGQFGYACHAHLALEVNRIIFSSQWLWFSTFFHAAENVQSANPAHIYASLSEPVQRNDVGNRYVKGLRALIIENIVRHVGNEQQSALLQAQVNSAGLHLFRPRVMLIDLEKAASRRRQPIVQMMAEWRENARAHIMIPGQQLQPNEYLIKDIDPGEGSVIIDG